MLVAPATLWQFAQAAAVRPVFMFWVLLSPCIAVPQPVSVAAEQASSCVACMRSACSGRVQPVRSSDLSAADSIKLQQAVHAAMQVPVQEQLLSGCGSLVVVCALALLWRKCCCWRGWGIGIRVC